VIILLLLPIVHIYGNSPCGLLKPPGLLDAVCLTIYPMVIFITLGGITDVFFYGLSGLILFSIHLFIWLIINSIIAFAVSYPINLCYRRFKRK